MTSAVMSAQALFEEFLHLVGKEVEISLSSSGELVRGKVLNSMFDSLILETPTKRRIIAFTDLNYFRSL